MNYWYLKRSFYFLLFSDDLNERQVNYTADNRISTFWIEDALWTSVFDVYTRRMYIRVSGARKTANELIREAFLHHWNEEYFSFILFMLCASREYCAVQ
jgi:hypothetical protein